MPALRQRPGKGPSASKKRTSSDSASSASDEKTQAFPDLPKDQEDEEFKNTRVISILDIFRIIFLLLLSSSALSYYVTTDSFIWGYKPWFTRWPVVKSYLLGPLSLTPAQLSLYNGTDPSLPIYLAINSTIYDVSANPRIYGAGGSYNHFAGVDATRAYVTGCFQEDRTPDLRGAELMFIPIEDDDESAMERGMSSQQKKVRREREMREAREKVKAQVRHWMGFFGNHKDYFVVGRVVGGPGIGGKGVERRELCEAASKARPKRSRINEKIRKGE
ncbi:hypothetical protein AJ79_09862 [Helicocarpus griseus UAMH5409]|uniref:Cytochrome b5 heme-binding domain-containing protein n=1 Tax=Helicocarpus griseus UAMH5409 TaxID=1447875 RepID=A0A2B7WGR5_9EURO|nr:hypothetical protein AJ79_09862 [Helicocarpus griseus UAMH5409]